MRALVYDTVRKYTGPKLRQAIRSNPVSMAVISKFFGSDIYSKSYFEQIESSERASVNTMAGWIYETLQPKTAVDVGCGPGHLMEAMHAFGVSVLGIDYADAAKTMVEAKRLPFEKVDLTLKAPVLIKRYDLAVCCEVAEHLDGKHADLLVWHLTNASNTVFLTAAEVGQGGLNHVNEQPNSYWIAKFLSAGFALDEKLTADAREVFLKHGVVHYLAKPMIYRKI